MALPIKKFVIQMNRYEVIAPIGEGAYGIVLKCKDKKTKKIFAIKKFKDKDTENLSIKKVLLRELRALRQLKHPNIIQLHGSFKQNDRLYLVFDYIKLSLLDLQDQSPDGLGIEVIKKIVLGVLKGLAEMHTNGFLHRDIKPENILVDPDNQPKIIDFGFCRGFEISVEPLTNYVATRWYRSPELLLSSVYGAEVDMWALGCVIGEMIDGQPLFPGDDFLDQLYNIYKTLGPLPESYREKVHKNEDLSGVNFDIYFQSFNDFDPDSLNTRYFNKVKDGNLIDLLKKMLDLNGETRISAEEALAHPFFNQPSTSSRKTIKFVAPMDLPNKDLAKSSIIYKNIELNLEATADKKNPKIINNKPEKRDDKENRASILPVIKTLAPFKISFKGGTTKINSQTTKSIYGKTLLNRFK